MQSTRRDQLPQPKPAAPKMAGGEPLPAQTGSRMSAAFGHDFSSVRVFHDDGAAQQAEGLGAQAFAQGGDLFFQSGFYDPHGADGQRLLAHELAHIVQEDRFGVGSKSASDASDASEREAEDVAGRAAAGQTVQIRQAAGAMVSRHPNDDEFTQGRQRLQALENYGKVSDGLAGTAPPQTATEAAPGGDVGFRSRGGSRAALTQGATPPALGDIGDVRGLLAGGESAPRGTRLLVGGEPLILGGGNSPEARIRGSRLPNLGTYPEIAGNLRGFGLEDSQMAFAQEIFRRTGQMPEGAEFAGLRGNPDALAMFNRIGLLNGVEGTRLAQHPTDLSIANRLVIEGGMNYDGMYGTAPTDPRAKPLGGELPATHQMAGASDRAVMDRLALMQQDPELMDRLRSQGLDPMKALLNDRGRGGDALGRRSRLVDSRLGLFDGLLEGGPPASHEEAAPFALDRLSRVPTPGGRGQWTGFGSGSGGSGGGTPPVAEANGPSAPHAATEPLLALPAPEPRLALPAPEPRLALPAPTPAAEAAPRPNAPTPDTPHAGPAPAGEGTVPAGESGATGAEGGSAHATMGQAAGIGAASGGLTAAINDLAIKRDFSLDSAGDIATQSALGAGGGVTQEAIAARLGGGIGGGALGGGAVGAITSGLTSTYNNGELYRQGKETAGQATANTVVDAGVGLGAGLAGAAAGAAIGSVVPVAGTLIGGAVGFGVGYLGNMLAQHSGFTDWAKKGLGGELNQYNQELSGVWNGIGHATEGIHNAWDSTKGGLRHAGHAVAEGAGHAWQGTEHVGANALHSAEHLGAEALHGIEHTGERVWHGAEHLGSRALHGAEHLGAEVLHGGEHLASRALHGGEHLLHSAEHLGERAWHGAEHLGGEIGHAASHAWHDAEHTGAGVLHGIEHAGAHALQGAEHLGSGVLQGVEHAGASALHTAEHLGAGALNGAEHAAHAVGNAASGAWHKLTSWF